VNEAQQEGPQTHFIRVGDREADGYEVFVAERAAGVDFLGRAAWERRGAQEEQYLWATALAPPGAEILSMPVPRRGEPPARTAVLPLRFGRGVLCPPSHRRAEHVPSVTIGAVPVLEEYPPADVEPREWLLLTPCAVSSALEALECVEWYAGRVGLAVRHTVLKRGGRIAARQ